MIFQDFIKKSVAFTLFFLCINLFADTNTLNIEQYSKKQKEKLYKKGQKIYENICPKIDLKKYTSLKELKKDIEKKSICGKQKEKNLLAVSFYLWSFKNSDSFKVYSSKIDVPNGAKCPVCGMFVKKYPKWVAKIDMGEYIHYFDGVKDMMKFYFYPNAYGHKHNKKDIKSMRVSDYYSLNQIDAKKAWYVIGSNVYGPMGHELIPFKGKVEAEVFKKNHYGKKIVTFEELNENIIFGLDK